MSDNFHEQTPDNANNLGLDVASGHFGHRLKAVDRAERLIMGCLVLEPRLFHHGLPDGRAFDEALAVDDFHSGLHRELFNRIYNRLADDEPLSLASLLGELAQGGRQDLSDLATAAEAEAEQVIGPEANERDPQELHQRFTELCQWHRAVREDREFAQHRGRLIQQANEKGNDVALNASVLQRVADRMANRTDPARIARLHRPS